MAKKEKTGFTNMLGGNDLVSKKTDEKEKITRLTLNIPLPLKQRMLSYIANTMNTNLSELTKSAITNYMDELEKFRT